MKDAINFGGLNNNVPRSPATKEWIVKRSRFKIQKYNVCVNRNRTHPTNRYEQEHHSSLIKICECCRTRNKRK